MADPITAAIGAAGTIGSAALGGGGSAPPQMNRFNNRSFINIAPARSNAGEILKNFWGPPVNGGFGGPDGQGWMNRNPADTGNAADMATPVSFQAGPPAATTEQGSVPWGLMTGALLLGLGVWYAFR